MEKFSVIIQFIRELYNKPEGIIPLHAPVFAGNEKKYLEDCIDSTFVSSVGKYVDLFEDVVASYTGAMRAVACVNGTNALQLALILSGVEQGDEVLTQPLTFVATANAISYCNARPVFVDVDLETLGMSPEVLANWLENNVIFKSASGSGTQPYNKATGRRISAIVPMHTFGHPCKIDEIISIADNYMIPVVEDAAESIGSLYKNRHTGTAGKIGVLSFNGNKIITTGGGGMILTNDESIAKRAKHISTTAKVPHPYEFYHDELGYNFRLPNVNAALGVAQMEQLPMFLKKKRQISLEYEMFFNKIGISFFKEKEFCTSNYWLNCIFLGDREERDSFLEFSNKNGVTTRPAWVMMNKLPMYSKCQTTSLANSQWIEDRLVNIPSSVLI